MGFHTVLVVEDEAFIRDHTCVHLMECGFHVMEAATADEAVGLLIKHPEIDLVFTNVQMPDGLDLARWVMESRPALPVMIATNSPARILDESWEAETFIKPYDRGQVVDRIRLALARKSQRPAA